MLVTKIRAIHKYINTNAAFEDFAESYLCFLVFASAKKNAEVIKFLAILKKYASNIFLSKKEKQCFA